jgi:hypothetical protein
MKREKRMSELLKYLALGLFAGGCFGMTIATLIYCSNL